MREVLVVGLGAVGAVYSLILKRSGCVRVTAVARSNYDAVNSQGVHFQSKMLGDIRGWKPHRLCSSVLNAADQAYDYVFVTTKAIPDVLKTSDVLLPLLTRPYSEKFAQPAYVLLQNGLNVELDLYDTLKSIENCEPRIISTAVYIGTNLLSPNVVEHNHFARMALGCYRHGDLTTTTNSDPESALLHDVASLVQDGGGAAEVVSEIQRKKFEKNFWNMAFATSSTLTGYTVPSLFRPPPQSPDVTYAPYVSPRTADLIEKYTIPAIEATLNELIVLARALGFPDSENGIPSSLPVQVIERTRALHVVPDSTHKPSMLLDAENDAPIEVEVIVGEIVRMARARNVHIPRIETLYSLLLVKQNQILRKRDGRS